MAEAAEDRNPIVFFDVTLGGTCRFLQMVVWALLTPRHPPLRVSLGSSRGCGVRCRNLYLAFPKHDD